MSLFSVAVIECHNQNQSECLFQFTVRWMRAQNDKEAWQEVAGIMERAES